MIRISDQDLGRYADAIKLSRPPWKAYSLAHRWAIAANGGPPPEGIDPAFRMPLVGGPLIADSIKFQVQADAIAALPELLEELTHMRAWARRTVGFIKDPQSQTELFEVLTDAARLGIE